MREIQIAAFRPSKQLIALRLQKIKIPRQAGEVKIEWKFLTLLPRRLDIKL
jgi:hypothetical protein